MTINPGDVGSTGEKAMPPKLPRSIEILDVALGTTAGSSAGIYVTVDANVTFRIDGDTSGVFQVVKVETDDVVTDPDSPPGHPPVVTLQPSLVVNGPGPIDVVAGQAIRVYVVFDCPSDPAHGAFNATAVMDGSGLPAPVTFLITATARLGTLQAVNLTSPDIAPGQTENFDFRFDSSLGHAVPVVFVYDSTSDGASHFSVPDQVFTVPAGAKLPRTIPVTCAPGTPVKNYSVIFRLRAQDGSRDFGYVQLTISVPPIIVTTVDTAPVKMTAGGITPVNVTIQSVLGGGTQVFFFLEDPPPGIQVSGPPITVNAGATVRGTIWINAADSSLGGSVRLMQSAFDATQITQVGTVSVSVTPPPANDDYLIVRVYWGSKWTSGGPFGWEDMDAAIQDLASSAFVRGLREYGVRSVSTPSDARPKLWIEGTFPQSNQFNDSDVIGLITGLVGAGKLMAPDAASPQKVLYVVFPQQGSFYSPDPTGELGRHGKFNYGGVDSLYAWVYQGGDVPGTTKGFGHELVEALCARVAGQEIGDPCQCLLGTSDGITLQPYLSKQRNLCVLPNMTDNSNVAATPPVPGKTSPDPTTGRCPG